MPKTHDITVIGAGLVGSALSIMLARRGFAVQALERRPDMRRSGAEAGRSINLALSTRGLRALQHIGLDLEQAVLKRAVPMHGRMIHQQDGALSFQPYGKDKSEYINSVSRAELNKTLMTHAEATQKVQITFNQRVLHRDLQACTLQVEDTRSQSVRTLAAPRVIGTDGSASVVREAMQRAGSSQCTQEALEYGYKELSIPPGPQGSFRLQQNALHIWPRGAFMLIALPNFDGSFTCTLFLPHTGAQSFANLHGGEAVRGFFNTHFADAVPHLVNLTGEFASNPVGHMVTVKCSPWHHADHTLLVGDAAHAIVPFFGQGANCGLEDCTVFNDGLATLGPGGNDWSTLLERFSALRKPHADAIADMAVENFTEMRDKVGNAQFLLEKAAEKRLMAACPGEFLSRYGMVTFSNIPYAAAQQAGNIADGVVRELCAGLHSVEELDLVRAKQLIAERFTPFWQQHREGVTAWT